jgi:hypothetical protein
MEARPLAVVALSVAMACGDDPTAVCSGSAPVQLVSGEWWLVGAPQRAGDYTFLSWFDDERRSTTVAGPACGVDPVRLEIGLMRPFRMHEDPADDDPTIACGAHGFFYRIDPTGRSASTLFAPHLHCAAQPTDHGLLLAEHEAEVWWLYPNFPDASSARRITDRHGPAPHKLVGDELFYPRTDGALHVQNLATGVDRPLLTGVARFDATASHVLWRAAVDAPVAPVQLFARSTGANIYLGLYHADEDEYVIGGPNRLHLAPDAWRFSPGGESVLHIPFAVTAPMAAFDRAGRPLEFPAWGQPFLQLADDTVILATGSELLAARPGAPAVVLDAPGDIFFGTVKWVDDHLELVVGDELRLLPLDGSPARLLARGVGFGHRWLDDDHLLTIHDGALTTIEPATDRHHVIARDVVDFTIMPGDGAYFVVRALIAGPDNGIWFAPEAALRAAPDG